MATAIRSDLSVVDRAACSLVGRQLTSADRRLLGTDCSHEVDCTLRLHGDLIVGKQPADRLSGGKPADVLGFVLARLPHDERVRVANDVHAAACRGLLTADPANRAVAEGLIDLSKKVTKSSPQLSGAITVEML